MSNFLIDKESRPDIHTPGIGSGDRVKEFDSPPELNTGILARIIAKLERQFSRGFDDSDFCVAYNVVKEMLDAVEQDVIDKKICFCDRNPDELSILCHECKMEREIIVDSLKAHGRGTVSRNEIADIIQEVVFSFKKQFKEDIKQKLATWRDGLQ